MAGIWIGGTAAALLAAALGGYWGFRLVKGALAVRRINAAADAYARRELARAGRAPAAR